jgi:hypothetical protein
MAHDQIKANVAGKTVIQRGEQHSGDSSSEEEVEVTSDKCGSNPESGNGNSGSSNGNPGSGNGNPGEEED